MFSLFRSIYQYREYLIQSVLRDLRKKYKRSTLGYFWSMLNPLLMMLVLTVVFSSMMSGAVEHYSVFLFAGMIPWAYFSTTILGSLYSISSNIRIISQIPVPKYLFVLSLSFSNLYTLLISLVPFVLISLLVGHGISWHLLLFPIAFIPLFLITTGVSLCLAALNVFFEDTAHLVNVLIQALYFMCPIIYPVSMLSPKTLSILELNPLFTVTVVFKDIMYYERFPDLFSFSYSCISGLVILAIGLFIFHKADKRIIYFV